MKRIITINRQFGSGGREVGKRLADALGISYYDKELINKIADATQFHPDYIESLQETVSSRHFFLTYGQTFASPHLMPSEQIQIAQTEIINQLAEKEECVVVGRHANYVLGEKAFKVFIYSTDMDARIQRCYEKVPSDRAKTPEQIKKEILKIDKQRRQYHNYYTGEEWREMAGYNFCIDTAKVPIKTAVKLIMLALEAQV